MLADLLRELRGDPQFMATVAAWRTLPAQPAQIAAPPDGLHRALTAALHSRGIDSLYTHQAQAVTAALAGEHVAVVTPTASGKTLCYNLPVFHTLLTDLSARALYLFPTKALAQDQLAELTRLTTALSPSHPLPCATYDGDTPSADRSRIRKTARILLSNPDMLHVGILPYHTQWAPFLAGLRWIVIDEMHTYRGVFGSQVANVLRRLQRLCGYYGGQPQFICTSATIANPAALAERLIERPVTLIAGNGAPRGEKQIILVNPPLVDAEKGIRRSATLEATDLAARCLHAGLQTIVFGRARLTTELLLTYLREKAEPRPPLLAPRSSLPAIRGYRGGYLPSERRAIEAGLRSGDVRGVVATNALELGIDIGALQAAVICGYPGSIASTWQQMGRAGRTTDASLALLVATGGALDQYVIQHPEFIFEQSPEHALINPDNLMLLLDQVRCAIFELPFATGERFGATRVTGDATNDTTGDVLALLVEEGDVHPHNGEFFWSGESYPARSVSLRSAGRDSVVIQAETTAQPPADPRRAAVRDPAASYTVIGAVDHASAPLLVHDGAIYLHEGQSYQVTKLDLMALRADVTPVAVDYYTEAMTETSVAVLAVHGQRATPTSLATFGDVEVTAQVIAYRRIKRHTHETLGIQPLDYPPQTLDTSAYWLAVQPAVQNALERAGLWYDSVNDYGPNWQEQRAKVRARDHYRCLKCGAPEPRGQEHDVHHRIPFRTFGCVSGVNEHYLLANRLENLMLLCRSCHQRLETAGRLRTGMDGLAYALANLAPVHLMCDRADLGVHVTRAESPSPSHPLTLSPSHPLATVYLYERVPAGLGFSTLLYEMHDDLLRAARALVGACMCQSGCPGCVGPILEEQSVQLATKRLTVGLLDALLA